MKCVIDIEADNLLQEATVIHCAVFKSVDTGQVWRFTKKESIIRMLDKCTYIIMHNGIGYDLPLIKKIYGYEYKGKILDTVLMSREVHKNIQVPKSMKEDCQAAGKKLSGPHSLATWGYRVGMGKVEHEDWSTFSPEMMHRCVIDVEITYMLYKILLGLEPEYIDTYRPWNKEKFPPRAVWLTMDFMKAISRQEQHGWKLDLDRCHRSVNQLSKWVGWIDRVLEPYLPVLPLIKEDRLEDNGDSNGFQAPFTKAGTLAVRLSNWIEKEEIDWDRDTIGGSFCRVTFRKVNLNSDKETKEWLLDMGWQPEEYNYSKKEVDEDGNPKRTSPKLNADDAFIGVDGKVGRLICKRVQCRHRQSNIQGWLERVRSDGRLESRISGFADTYRVRHANIANVPNVNSFYGRNMRKCFICEEGMILVSADAAACQDRMIISRARDVGIEDPVFEDMVLNGDKARGTDSHSRARDEINILFAEMGIPPINRSAAKNFSYAYKFGGGAKKLGFMAGEKNETKAIKIGKAIKEAFDTVFQAQITLQEHLKKEWIKQAKMKTVKYKWNGREQERKEFYNGRIKALDGRQVLIRSEKDILVYTVQSDEALTMSKATVLVNKRLDERYIDGIDFKQVGFFHDEYTFEVRPEIAEDVKKILEDSIADAGEYFNLNLPQIGEGEIGRNWEQIH